MPELLVESTLSPTSSPPNAIWPPLLNDPSKVNCENTVAVGVPGLAPFADNKLVRDGRTAPNRRVVIVIDSRTRQKAKVSHLPQIV